MPLQYRKQSRFKCCSIQLRSACYTLYQERRIEPEEACQQRPYQYCNPQVVDGCQRGLHKHSHITGFISRQLHDSPEAVSLDKAMQQQPKIWVLSSLYTAKISSADLIT